MKARTMIEKILSGSVDMKMMTTDLHADVVAVSAIKAVPTILEVICQTTGMGFAAIVRITEDRWIACGVRDEIRFGLRPGDQLQIETTICRDVRQSRQMIVIDNVAEDDIYSGHPTPAMYGFQSYISIPIILSDGRFFGTLCAIDRRPARLNTAQTVGMFSLFAELIAFHIDAIKRLDASEASLLDERKTSELREQFIAVLGHDLRNPLTAINFSAEILRRSSRDESASARINLIQRSVARMAEIIDNVLDFARGRLGGGLILDRDAASPLEPVLDQVIAELRAGWPDRQIDTHLAITEPVDCDRGRIGQLLSNLLANALAHGAAHTPVTVRAATVGGVFTLSVSNAGRPIPAEVQARLFHPFTRASVEPGQQGLGLGLHIASEIARAHLGRIEVVSSAEETRFSFSMPLA